MEIDGEDINKAKERKFDDIDLGLKIGSKEEAAWTQIKKAAELDIEQSKRAILINEEIVKLAIKKISEEEAKKTDEQKI
jgi:hypothetical protein